MRLAFAGREITRKAMDLAALGKLLLGLGVGLALFGTLLLLVGKGLLPHLPGDLAFRVGNVRVFLPIATSIVISVLLTVVLNVLMRR
jgi:Protein of unknown function (DUF2905)